MWIVRFGGEEPTHHLVAGRLITEAPDADGLLEALSTLRSLARWGEGSWPVRDCVDTETMIACIRQEIADCWPSFQLRSIDWARVCERWEPRVRAASDPIDAAARWVAELGDAHTAVVPARPQGRLPYVVKLTDREVFWQVPDSSHAGKAGVLPGWTLRLADVAGILARTGASPHSRPLMAGLRAMRGPLGTSRLWTARSPGGRQVQWEEPFASPTQGPLVGVGTLPSGAGLLRIRSWTLGSEGALNEALDSLDVDRLVIDLRGNGGGNLHVAWRFRDRFLTSGGTVGWIRSTVPGGGLGPSEPLLAGQCTRPWRGRLKVLTDELTYSASEDFLLGLQGQTGVTICGRPSGGGSGRCRMVRLLPGWRLRISTSLTWDRRHRVVEGQGIVVDIKAPWPDPTRADPALALADRW